MLEIILLGALVAGGFFVTGLLLEGYISQSGGTMNERRAVVFEVYRYAVCFIMIVLFGVMAFQLLSTLVTDLEHPANAAGPGVGTVIAALIFLAHWMMPNPAIPKAAGNE